MKTPKREHWCRRCCGPVDVHLDPSGETEEYSICRVCHRKTSSHCGHTWEPYKEHARWTRKNREARLKNAIREKVWQIKLKKAQMIGYMRACVTLRGLLNKEMRLAATYEKAVSASGTYGQDVEGS